MTLRIADIALTDPVLLAPLAGITDLPFRDLVCRFGAGLVVSEMIASQEMVQARPSTRAKAELGFDRARTSVQIAGCEAYWMAECARLCAGNGAAIIDINMGCPAKQVTNGASGSALMREPDFALSLIAAVVDAVDIPVTLKMRLGWDDDSHNAANIARRAEEAGIRMVTIHGRTRCQFYKGRADWHAIGEVVDAVSIPVVANGDIIDGASARQALDRSGAAGVMVGRGAQGKPWLLSQIAAVLAGRDVPESPDLAARIEIILTHYEAMLAFYGPELGLKIARKHLGWYLDGIPGSGEIRATVLRAPNPRIVIDNIRRLSEITDLETAA